MPNDWITTNEAMGLLSYAQPSSIARLVAKGTLTPVAKAPGKRGAYFFNRADVERIAAERAA